MIHWRTVFDEAYPVAGATAADLDRLVAEIGQPLPASYLSLLAWSNGGEFRTGERWFQFFPALHAGHGVLAMRDGYHVARYMPGALPFAFNGGSTFYLFDLRRSVVGDEYLVVCSHSGNLGWEPDECFLVADSFESACRGIVK